MKLPSKNKATLTASLSLFFLFEREITSSLFWPRARDSQSHQGILRPPKKKRKSLNLQNNTTGRNVHSIQSRPHGQAAHKIAKKKEPTKEGNRPVD
jgi:hypothetical protein